MNASRPIAVLAFLLTGPALWTQNAPHTPPAAAPAATTPAPAPESPDAIYREAMHPLDVVRGDMSNWSDAELGALAVGMRRAREACGQAKPADYSGEDVYELAHLCSFGQDWMRALAAAKVYLDSNGEMHRAQAYALRINALLNMNATQDAILTAREMLTKLPYDAEVAYALNYLEFQLEHAGNGEGVVLTMEEHPKLVEALAQSGPLKATHGDAVVSPGSLFESGMKLAFMQHDMGGRPQAQATFEELHEALRKNGPVSPEDQARIEAVTTRFALLDRPLPALTIQRSLLSPTARPQLRTHPAKATVFVLFPDWCVQCRNMMKPLTQFDAVNKETPIYAYGLMFSEQEGPPSAAQQAVYKEMLGTRTLLVPADTALTLGAIDFPLAVATDENGLVRFVGVLPMDAFNGDGYVQKVIVRMTGIYGQPIADPDRPARKMPAKQ